MIASKCLSVLINLLESSNPIVSKNTLAEFEQFSFESIPEEKVTSTLEKIVDRMDLFKPESIPSVVPKLLGLYGEALSSAPYILEHLVNNYEVLDVDTRYFLFTFIGNSQLFHGSLFAGCIYLSQRSASF
jgi:hypothetical protein